MSFDGRAAADPSAEAEALARAASPWPRVEVGGELGRARKEWLHTNGAGAYASSTLACMHTRRYHGLLVAALAPPLGRHVMLSHVDVTLTPEEDALAAAAPRRGDEGQAGPSARADRRTSRPRWELAKHQFPGIDPDAGPFYLQRFDQDPLPRWTYALPLAPAAGLGAASAELEVTLALVRGRNVVVLRYVWRGPGAVKLTLRPLLAVRHMHRLQRENGGMSQRVELRAGGAASNDGAEAPPFSEVRVQPNRALPRVCFRCQGTFVGSPDWWRRFEYLAERDRGLDFEEDLWTPGHLEVRAASAPVYLVAAIEALPDGEPAALLEAAAAALRAEDPGPGRSLLERRLTIAAEAFRADAARRPAVIAGYPWFEVWGRDALIALPGLYLVPRKLDGAVRVLRGIIDSMRDGVVPNRAPDAGGAPDLDAADATLWLFEAARLMADALGDTHPFVTDELLLALRDAFEAARRGAPGPGRVTEDGLFATDGAGPRTWMDARVRGAAVTPRSGCPVELSVLWARGAATLARLARASGDDALAARAAAAASAARRAFHDRFWCDDTGYPYDIISERPDGEGAYRDATLRPNAVIALAVDPACFTDERAASLLERARLSLVTRAGLRTLAPGHPSYAPRYGGGLEARDAAYHQGTVWPFLLGFYVRAAIRSSPLGEHVVPLLHRLVASAVENELSVGQVPEVADAEPPHLPGGCVAQAWSVAELLRALAWDLGGAALSAASSRADPPSWSAASSTSR